MHCEVSQETIDTVNQTAVAVRFSHFLIFAIDNALVCIIAKNERKKRKSPLFRPEFCDCRLSHVSAKYFCGFRETMDFYTPSHRLLSKINQLNFFFLSGCTQHNNQTRLLITSHAHFNHICSSVLAN